MLKGINQGMEPLPEPVPCIKDQCPEGRMDTGLIRPSARQFIFTPSPIARTTIALSSDIPITEKKDLMYFCMQRTLPLLLENTSLFKSLVYSGYSGRFSTLHVRLKSGAGADLFPVENY